ncbi:MAG TPA: hypothetical protein VN721_15565 [Flavipsychrobacter sp.]|nr:hypothetical protein [Flavipsychrobacter sp.]
MSKQKRHKTAYIILFILLAGICIGAGYIVWLTQHYKSILKERIPEMIVKSSDSLYHISFSDISINVLKKSIVISNVRLWADSNQANVLRRQGRYSPNTISFIYAPFAAAYGIDWDDLFSKGTIHSSLLVVNNAKWYMQTIKHHPDLSMIEEPEKHSFIKRMEVTKFEIINPDITYHYVGDSNTYYCFLKGGSASLYNWAVDKDINKDTSVFLYAQYGNIKPKTFRLEKDDKIYTAGKPNIEFTSTQNSITLKNIRINMTNMARNSDVLLETYNCRFPAIEFTNFNWKQLLHSDVLIASSIHTEAPFVNVHYNRQNFPGKDKTGSFPNQIIRQFITTYIKTLFVKNGRFLYNEPNKKNENALFQFDDINGSFSNITNIDSMIARNKSCIVKLRAKFMNKSPVEATFDLSLTDPKGHFLVVGSVSNLDGKDVTQQAAAFTLAKVTSFHLSRMDGRIEGNEGYAHGQYTMLYDGLKLSLFKFKSNDREGKTGLFSFIADATVLYPSNPMPGKDVRKTETILPRDPHSGFMFLIWQNMYLGAEKIAVRDEKLLILAGSDKEDKNAAKSDHKVWDTDKDKPKKREGIFRKLFKRRLFIKKK